MVEYVKVDQPILIIGYDWERYGKENLSVDEQKNSRK